MEKNSLLSEIVNIVLGILSIAGLVSGFFIEEYRITFWIVSIALLIFVVIGYYVADNRTRIFSFTSKIKKSLYVCLDFWMLKIALLHQQS